MRSKPRVSDAKPPSVRKSVRKRTVSARSSSALKMMEKTPDTAIDLVQDFLTTGRTGRRNAMPDILGEHAATSVADLPACMEQLNTSEASTSGTSGSSFTLQYAPPRPNPGLAPPTLGAGATPPANATPPSANEADRTKS